MGRRVLGKMVPVWAALFRLLKKKAPRSLPSIATTPNIVMKAMRCGALETESLRYADNYLLRQPQPKALLPACTSRPHTDSFRVHHVVNQEALNESDPCADADLHAASSTTAGRISIDSDEHYSTAASSLDTPAEGDSSCSSSPSRASATSYASDGLEVYCDAVSNSRHDQRDCKEQQKQQEEEEAVAVAVAAAATETETETASCNRGSTCVASRSCSSRPRHGNELCRSFEAPVASLDKPAKPSAMAIRRVGGTAKSGSNHKPTPFTIKKAPNDCKPKPCSSALNRKQMRRLQNGSSHGADHMAVVQYSEDPLSDFSSSIVHMVVSHQLREQQDLEDLFLRYLRLNAPEHHRTIALAFLDAMERLGSFEQRNSQQSQNSSNAHLH